MKHQKLLRELMRSFNLKNKKIYSLHAPGVECVAKGKAHKKYEFGCKMSIATTSKEPWIVSISAGPGNPYDDHTFKKDGD